jgi:hypothetical protein
MLMIAMASSNESPFARGLTFCPGKDGNGLSCDITLGEMGDTKARSFPAGSQYCYSSPAEVSSRDTHWPQSCLTLLRRWHASIAAIATAPWISTLHYSLWRSSIRSHRSRSWVSTLWLLVRLLIVQFVTVLVLRRSPARLQRLSHLPIRVGVSTLRLLILLLLLLPSSPALLLVVVSSVVPLLILPLVVSIFVILLMLVVARGLPGLRLGCLIVILLLPLLLLRLLVVVVLLLVCHCACRLRR